MLNILVEEGLDTAIFRCEGSLVLGEEGALLCPALRQRERTILLDLSLVDRIDAAGEGALIALQAAGIYLKIADPSKAVADVLKLTHVDSLFEIVNLAESDADTTRLPTVAFPAQVPAIA